MTQPAELHLVEVPGAEFPDGAAEPLSAETPEELVAAVRRAASAGVRSVVEPDGLATTDGEWDIDSWLALVSVVVVEGAAAIRTSHPAEARRVVDVHHAIATASGRGAP